MIPTTEPIRSVPDLLGVIGKLDFSTKNHPHLRPWFRGQPKGGWDLRPGVYRKPWKPALGDPLYEGVNEKYRLRTERHLTQDFRVYSASLRNGDETDEEIYFLQQHYRMPTRLLDWSGNPLAALYFAVSERQYANDDGEMYVMDAFQLAHAQKVTDDFEGIGTSRNLIFKEAIQIISNWKKDEFPKFIMPIRPDHFDPRITRQQSYFTFHVPSRPVLTEVENPTLKRIPIPHDAKVNLEAQLSLLGMNPFAAFGNLERLAEWLKKTQRVE